MADLKQYRLDEDENIDWPGIRRDYIQGRTYFDNTGSLRHFWPDYATLARLYRTTEGTITSRSAREKAETGESWSTLRQKYKYKVEQNQNFDGSPWESAVNLLDGKTLYSVDQQLGQLERLVSAQEAALNYITLISDPSTPPEEFDIGRYTRASSAVITNANRIAQTLSHLQKVINGINSSYHLERERRETIRLVNADGSAADVNPAVLMQRLEQLNSRIESRNIDADEFASIDVVDSAIRRAENTSRRTLRNPEGL